MTSRLPNIALAIRSERLFRHFGRIAHYFNRLSSVPPRRINQIITIMGAIFIYHNVLRIRLVENVGP